MALLYQNKTVLITGASSGIGAACARAFAEAGAAVVPVARRIERLEALQAEIEAKGGKALALAADVTDQASLENACRTAAEHFGGLDVVIANAGFGVAGLTAKLTTADYRRQFDTNFFGVLNTVYAALPWLEKSQGQLALVGSVSGRMATPTSGPYTSSKFAVVGLAECLYYELAESGISVSLINPGFVSSEIRSVNNQGDYTGKPDPVGQWLVMPAEKAAKKIVRRLYRRKPEIILTGHGHLLVFIARHFPRTLRTILRLGTRGRLHTLRDKTQVE